MTVTFGTNARAADATFSIAVYIARQNVYRLRYLPSPTRENSFPPANESQRAKDIIILRGRIDRLAASIRGMAVPTQDKIWRWMRKEMDVLNQLISSDFLLISTCDAVRSRVAGLTPDSWRQDEARPRLEEQIGEAEAVSRDRQRVLQIA